MRKIMLLMLLVMALFSAFSCAPTVSQQEYDRVSGELSSIQSQLESLKGKSAETEILETKYEELTKQYNTAKSEYDTLQTKYEGLSGENEELNKQYDIMKSDFDNLQTKYIELSTEYEELSKMKSNLLATVSHELRTPLATIKGYSTMILDYFSKLSSDEKKDYLKSIDNSTDRLAKLVDNLLDTSRMEAGLLKLEKTSTSIRQLIQKVTVEASVRANQHHIVMMLGKKLPRVVIDAKRIRQVLDNLVDNAAKYSPKGTTIYISDKIYGP